MAGSSQLEQGLSCPSQPAPDEVRRESRKWSGRTSGQWWGEGGQDFKGFHLLNDIKTNLRRKTENWSHCNSSGLLKERALIWPKSFHVPY